MARVVVVGSSNTDMVVNCNNIPRPGETVLGGYFVMASGGKGANQAVQAARLGAETIFIARVGNDVFGDSALAAFEQEGMDTSRIVRDRNEPSGVALIVVDGDGENAIAVAPGANACLSAADVAGAEREIAAADVALAQLEIPVEVVTELGRICNRVGTRFILNPAPARDLSGELLSMVDVLTPNEHEVVRLAGMHEAEGAKVARAAEEILSMGARAVVVTMGAEGAMVCTRCGICTVPSPQVVAVDTTAAGDAFNGALAVRLAEGADLKEAALYACRAAALACTKLGAQPSLADRATVDSFSG